MPQKKIFDYTFLSLGLLIQVITFLLSSPFRGTEGVLALSLLSGCLGICSVCLASQANIFTYLFGFAQVITYTWLCWKQRFYGEIAINAYYFFTMIYGVVLWKRRLQSDSSTVTTLAFRKTHRASGNGHPPRRMARRLGTRLLHR